MFRGDRLSSKYKAVKTIINGQKFDSRAEASYFLELLKLQRKGIVTEIQLQPKVYMTLAEILYKPDFKVTYNDGRVEFIDVKGVSTPVFKIKEKLWRHYGQGTLVIVKLNGMRFVEVSRVTTVGLE